MMHVATAGPLSKSMYPLDEDRSIRVCVAVRVSFVGVVAAVVGPVDRAHAVNQRTGPIMPIIGSARIYSALVGRRVRVWIRVSILTTSSNPRSILRRVWTRPLTHGKIIQVPRRRCIVHHATRPQRQSVFLVVVADR